MYKKILYPIKFEEFSLDVLSCVLHFKKVGVKEIILLHVIDVARLPMDKYEGYNSDDVKRLTEIASLKMDEAVRMVKDAGLRAKKKIETGVPYREILKAALKEKVSLIASGKQKKGIIGEIFIGSTTDKIIRYGNIPVYIAKHPAVFGGGKETCAKYCEIPFRRVLYPTDWSDCAETALAQVKGLKNTGIEEVVIAHIMDEKAMRMQTPKKLKEFWNADKEKMESVKHELEKNGFKVKMHIRIGKPNTDLIRIAREENISLIVMGSHGKSYIEGVLWGSVSKNVAEYSDRPVLLVSCKK
ncbi:MAG: universal stress protein [Nitrospirae bacterium]|nr:universal stress protein [Nitrospirota bacterium]MCL5977539.1 universal stress protein [Nitrospirota bacterium]